MSKGTVGVVGAGTMGTGVAYTFAAAGHPVVLVDVTESATDLARRRIRELARFATLNAGRSAAPAKPVDEILELITFGTDLDAAAEAGYLIENITESWSAKAELYPRLAARCSPDCIIAANTSAIPITRLAARTTRPDRVIGNHFMNPVYLMPMVEVITGVHTSADTVAAAERLLAGIGKDTVVVHDSPGFVTNRVLMLAINEAIFLLHEAVAPAVDIDLLFRRCLGHRMGPLETADLIGLDTVLYSLEVLLETFNDPKYRPCPLLRQYVDAGLLGRKTGRGFHSYEDETIVEKGA